MSLRRLSLFSVFLSLVLAAPASTGDWTRFRGPNGSGVASEAGLPTKWSDDSHVKWKRELPGAGASSPIVVGEKVIVTCYSGYGTGGHGRRGGRQRDLRRHVLCVHRKTGKTVWEKTVEPTLPEDHAHGTLLLHGYASHTPATDGERVYVFFGKTGLLCFDMNGNQLWKKSLGTGSGVRGWGTAASPILYKDTVIVNASAEDESIVALNKKTGEQVWKQKVSGLRGTWCTPIIVAVPDPKRDELVLNVPYEVWSLNPSTGKLLWYCDGISSSTMCTSLVAQDGVIYATGGRSAETLAVRAGGKGNVSKTHVLWRVRRAGSNVASPVVSSGLLYLLGDHGKVYGLDATTGARVFAARLRGMPQFFASPLVADDKIYAVARDRGVYVLAAGSKFKQLAHNRFASDTSAFNASPAVSGGELFLRSNKYLYCLAERGREK